MATTTEMVIAARKASGNTIAQMTELAGLRSTNTYQGREDDPLEFRLGELKGMYEGMNEISRPILKEAVMSIFLP